MLKFVTGNENLIQKIQRFSILKHLFIYDYSKLNIIQDENFYTLVYSHIAVSNGLTKTTLGNRFKDLDEVTIQLIAESDTCSFHDIGVSNGITSLELYQKVIINNKTKLNFFISDKYVKLFYKGKLVKRFYDSEGNLVSVNFMYLHISRNIGKIFFISRLLFKLFKKKIDLNKSAFNEILLLSPQVYQNVESGNIVLIDFDVFDLEVKKSFSFLRCMNVLMPAYFSIPEIISGVSNLKNSLDEGGYLLLGRTEVDNVNHATFYQKSNNELKAIVSINKGFDYNNPI